MRATEKNDIELYFEWWMDELITYGYIKKYHREPEQFEVLPPFSHKREKHFKTKPNEAEDFNMLNNMTYKYDYRILWDPKAIDILTNIYIKDEPFEFGMPHFVSHNIEIDGVSEIVSYVDVKPHGSAQLFSGSLGSSFTFPFVQKIMMYKYHIFINKAIPTPAGKKGANTCLFAKTFTPNRYKFTDAGHKKRKTHHRVVPFESFAQRQKDIVEQLKFQKYQKNGGGQQSLL